MNQKMKQTKKTNKKKNKKSEKNIPQAQIMCFDALIRPLGVKKKNTIGPNNAFGAWFEPLRVEVGCEL